MKKKLLIIYLLIVLTPIVVLGWISMRLTKEQESQFNSRVETLLINQLADFDNKISNYLKDKEIDLIKLTEIKATDNETMRAIIRKQSFVSNMFVLDANGNLIYPFPNNKLTKSEEDFLNRTKSIFKNGEIFYQPDEYKKRGKSYGWYTWYWEKGINLIFWKKDNQNRIIGTEIPRLKLLSEIISQLPAKETKKNILDDGRIMLFDSNDKTVYIWGRYIPEEKEKAKASLALQYPLNSWQLKYFLSPNAFQNTGKIANLQLFFTLFVIALILIGLAFYFYKESTRAISLASKRVSFVNQVSHELRTPLTNISMYTELLSENLIDKEPTSKKYLDVILSETGRLSRMIGNVLTFGRQQRHVLRLHRSEVIVDDIISSVLEKFLPAFTLKNIKINFRDQAKNKVYIDPDAFEQILGNLFNNVEKYASTGGIIKINSIIDEDKVIVTITDNGPGIPDSKKEIIFKPFVRLSNKLSDGVTGTGIGLSIARELARLHGGELKLISSDKGACFEITLESKRGKK